MAFQEALIYGNPHVDLAGQEQQSPSYPTKCHFCTTIINFDNGE